MGSSSGNGGSFASHGKNGLYGGRRATKRPVKTLHGSTRALSRGPFTTHFPRLKARFWCLVAVVGELTDHAPL